MTASKRMASAVKAIPKQPIAVRSAVVEGSKSASASNMAPSMTNMMVNQNAICLWSFARTAIGSKVVSGGTSLMVIGFGQAENAKFHGDHVISPASIYTHIVGGLHQGTEHMEHDGNRKSKRIATGISFRSGAWFGELGNFRPLVDNRETVRNGCREQCEFISRADGSTLNELTSFSVAYPEAVDPALYISNAIRKHTLKLVASGTRAGRPSSTPFIGYGQPED
jgi:hypothetical protein